MGKKQYVFTCSKCDKVIASTSEAQFDNNMQGHLGTHGRFEAKKGEVLERELC